MNVKSSYIIYHVMYRMLLVSIKHMDGSRPMLACIVSFYHDIEND